MSVCIHMYMYMYVLSEPPRGCNIYACMYVYM